MGTENDRVNCPFYFKIGACRHGDRCSRLHTRPRTSPTLLLSNMYQRPDMVTLGMDPQVQAVDPHKIQKHFEEFYEDLFVELSRYGDIESLNICDNLADHLVGNVYIQFGEEKHAARALKSLTGKKFAGRPIIIEFSPVTDFREATCRKYEENTCNRGGYCDFMHLKKISRELRRRLFGTYRRRHSRSRSRSQSPYRRRGGQEESPHGGLCSGRRHDDRNRRPTSRSPGHRRGRSRSPPARRRNGSPGARESSAERRAKIEQWNREKEQSDPGDKGDKWNTGARESSAERRAKIKQFIRENVQSNPGDKGGKWNTNNKNDIWHHHDQLRKQQLQLPRPPLPRPPQDREWDP